MKTDDVKDVKKAKEASVFTEMYLMFLETIKPVVRSIYKLQKIRVGMGNSIVINFKKKMGMDLTIKEDDGDNKENREAKKMLKILREQFKRIADGVIIKKDMIDDILLEKSHERVRWQKTMDAIKENVNIMEEESKSSKTPVPIISNDVEFQLMKEYEDMVTLEENQFKHLDKLLMAHFPIYSEFLKNVNQVGPAIGGILISEIDIEKTDKFSKLLSYCGLDVAQDGRGRSRRKEHQVVREYKDKNGKMQTKDSITFNPLLKPKLIGVLASNLHRGDKNPIIKTKSPYIKVYEDYLHRLENHPFYKDLPLTNEEAVEYLNNMIPIWKEMSSHVTIVTEGRQAGMTRTPIQAYYAEVAEEMVASMTTGCKKKETDKVQIVTSVHLNKKKKMTRSRMADRYMVKMFLKDFWIAYRLIAGLPVTSTYEEAKLGMLHHNATALENFFKRYPFMEKYRTDMLVA